ncbi:Methylated-DNA--protein-cysteine methyltransferase [Candidatus Methanobinarius endosymbioticus]|uniref:Methylated-DNA--protein-cysteine methyltransferase n=1 Tax=Candidatus Methanobinarius endosymbioticus TaxID=2006182 RepID=A0A366MB03_9EURY|nr:Methylated-DNA--protein-cysteine methyltransferase [Candidatus Methanobinarius endosymbioticus]
MDFSEYLEWEILNITHFEKNIYIATMNIPKSQVRFYKEIGDSIGTTRYRAVDNALNKNPIVIIVPCHRVIGSSRKLIGFTTGLDLKREVFINEGIEIKRQCSLI